MCVRDGGLGEVAKAHTHTHAPTHTPTPTHAHAHAKSHRHIQAAAHMRKSVVQALRESVTPRCVCVEAEGSSRCPRCEAGTKRVYGTPPRKGERKTGRVQGEHNAHGVQGGPPRGGDNTGTRRDVYNACTRKNE